MNDDISDNPTDDETLDSKVTTDDLTDESDIVEDDTEDNKSDDVSVDEKYDDLNLQDTTDDAKDVEVKADDSDDTQVGDKKASEDLLFDIDVDDTDDDSLYVLDATDISDYVIEPVEKTEDESTEKDTSDEVQEDITQDNDTESSPKTEDELLQEEFSEEDNSKFEFAPYTKVDEVMLSFKHSKNVMKILQEMVASEAPLSEEWLLKRLAGPVYDRKSVSSYVKDNFENELLMNSMGDIYRRGGYYYIANKPVKFRASSKDIRPFEYIAIDELASGLLDLLKICKSATREGLFKTLVKALGYARVETNQVVKLNKAIESLGDIVLLNGDMVKYNG